MWKENGWIRCSDRPGHRYRLVGAIVAVFAASCASNPDATPPEPNIDASYGSTPDANAERVSNASNDAAPLDDVATVDIANTSTDHADGATGEPQRDAAPTGPDAPSSDSSGMRDGPVFTGAAKIMVLGSSNESGTCWRAFLWQKMRAAGITDFDFVGSLNVGPDCNVPGYDKDCEARSGTIVTGISAATYRGWFAAHPPDIVLQHFGGADVMSGVPPASVIAEYSVIVEQARSVNPKVIFVVAQHTPEDPVGCATCDPDTRTLNAAIPPWAAMTTTAVSPVLVVDLYTGLDIVADFSDRVHLNTSGSEKVSDRWLAVLRPILQP